MEEEARINWTFLIPGDSQDIASFRLRQLPSTKQYIILSIPNNHNNDEEDVLYKYCVKFKVRERKSYLLKALEDLIIGGRNGITPLDGAIRDLVTRFKPKENRNSTAAHHNNILETEQQELEKEQEKKQQPYFRFWNKDEEIEATKEDCQTYVRDTIMDEAQSQHCTIAKLLFTAVENKNSAMFLYITRNLKTIIQYEYSVKAIKAKGDLINEIPINDLVDLITMKGPTAASLALQSKSENTRRRRSEKGLSTKKRQQGSYQQPLPPLSPTTTKEMRIREHANLEDDDSANSEQIRKVIKLL
jgi:hypothetical protein